MPALSLFDEDKFIILDDRPSAGTYIWISGKEISLITRGMLILKLTDIGKVYYMTRHEIYRSVGAEILFIIFNSMFHNCDFYHDFYSNIMETLIWANSIL